MEERHVLVVRAQDRPGVLLRVVGQFARRGLSIDELQAGPTADAGVSLIRASFRAPSRAVRPLVSNVERLVNVLGAELKSCTDE